VLREDKRAKFDEDRVLGLRRYRFTSGTLEASATLGRGDYRQLLERQAVSPVVVLETDGRTWWMFRDRVYQEDEGLDAEDVLALALDRERKRDRQLRRAHDLLRAEVSTTRRESIPEELRRLVFRRDEGACVTCGSRELLQFDHIIPVARGGATTIDNLQVLCANCNRAKSDDI
jgi:5-methylcytosine-specific restriction endonuclease McrA